VALVVAEVSWVSEMVLTAFLVVVALVLSLLESLEATAGRGLLVVRVVVANHLQELVHLVLVGTPSVLTELFTQVGRESVIREVSQVVVARELQQTAVMQQRVLVVLGVSVVVGVPQVPQVVTAFFTFSIKEKLWA
jgi:hypothetical protein